MVLRTAKTKAKSSLSYMATFWEYGCYEEEREMERIQKWQEKVKFYFVFIEMKNTKTEKTGSKLKTRHPQQKNERQQQENTPRV